MKLKNWYLPMVFILFIAGCININLFEKQVPIPSNGWKYNFNPNFVFDIKDTTSQYMLYVVVRHTDQYKYNNLWIDLKTKFPDSTTKSQKLNLELAAADRWEGTGLNDIFEVRKLISEGPVTFKRSGEYTFTISQIMRDNPLNHILNIGLRVEKVN